MARTVSKQRDWFCPNCKTKTGSTKAWGFKLTRKHTTCPNCGPISPITYGSREPYPRRTAQP